ncbi:hypothetical protein QYS49_00335 [Marivirga salinae]|uniref:Uncharacterized protein n=1 Tax=Marivirga salinarum TaxID=3059078 RepID=A0AA49JGT3_9BACT|nr:hypothetical protein [Marivirga sp. BDSF4-3]WKK75947.1 hypothetical protein QYS49_00335 [Marivirga sp. BDSF4-3]
MIVKRKRIWNTILFLMVIPGVLMFFIIGIIGIFSDNSIGEKLLSLFFTSITFIALYSGKSVLMKLISNNPEFELTEKEFIVYDDPKYSIIPFKEMLGCETYSGHYEDFIGIHLKDSSRIKSNMTKIYKTISGTPPERSKIVFLTLRYANINAEYLVDLLSKKITDLNTDSKNTGNNT